MRMPHLIDSSAEHAGSLAPAHHSNLVFQTVFESLQQHILRGDWRPGERLPSIVQLAKELAASTGSVREALRSLQSIGLVTIAHGRGVFVAGAHGPSGLDREDARAAPSVALLEARRVVEPELAALAAERGSGAELGDIEWLARQMEAQSPQERNFEQLDDQFHCSIAHAAHNPVLYQVIENSIDLLLERHAVTSQAPATVARAVLYHMLIAEALRERNGPQARLLMQAHINDMLREVLPLEELARHVGQ